MMESSVADLRVTRALQIPDPLRVNRCLRSPELGPRILFFSGGTALTEISRTLKRYTHNSIHLITPFDCGGSSAVLRRAFGMPAIGDLRSRLIALADESVLGHPEVAQLFRYRLDKQASQAQLRVELQALEKGHHPLVEAICEPIRSLIITQLGYLRRQLPEHFDLRGASIGNLILAGGYLNNHRQLAPSLYLFSRLVEVQGIVCTVADGSYYLGAELSNGERVIGQHRMTGKEVAPLSASIERLYLNADADQHQPIEVPTGERLAGLIASADLIVYPPGSFFSSLQAALLPDGIVQAIAANPCPKLYLPNLGKDPEQLGLDGEGLLQRLLGTLRRGQSELDSGRLLNFVAVDESQRGVAVLPSAQDCARHGVQYLPASLARSDALYDPERVVELLLSLT